MQNFVEFVQSKCVEIFDVMCYNKYAFGKLCKMQSNISRRIKWKLMQKF